MHINSIHQQIPFTTKDGSTILSILDQSNAPVRNQSLAEARLPAKKSTQRHYHKASEEFYFLLEGQAEMEIDGITKEISSGDAVLIPAGSWHQITASGDGPIRLLCCCSPPYSHEDTYFE
ncbi:MAG TPA: cupin domain-containing protein [Verrucomicrobia bacterium]|nr:cupin domain-containing protein [Verrucomicrobiales bacterium]HIL53641.1 cupin domain-containing protein [Verrucomicrobiota bacterium]